MVTEVDTTGLGCVLVEERNSSYLIYSIFPINIQNLSRAHSLLDKYKEADTSLRKTSYAPNTAAKPRLDSADMA